MRLPKIRIPSRVLQSLTWAIACGVVMPFGAAQPPTPVAADWPLVPEAASSVNDLQPTPTFEPLEGISLDLLRRGVTVVYESFMRLPLLSEDALLPVSSPLALWDHSKGALGNAAHALPGVTAFVAADAAAQMSVLPTRYPMQPADRPRWVYSTLVAAVLALGACLKLVSIQHDERLAHLLGVIEPPLALEISGFDDGWLDEASAVQSGPQGQVLHMTHPLRLLAEGATHLRRAA